MPEVESVHLCGQVVLANHEGGRVARLDPDSGQPLWWHRPEGGYSVSGAAHFSQPEGGLLLLANQAGLEALDESGQLLWARPWHHSAPRKVRFWGDLALVALEDGALVAVEAYSGQRRWGARLSGQPRWMERSGDLLLVGARARGQARTHVTAREVSTGRLLWETQTEGTPHQAPVSWGDALAWTFAARGACGVQVVERSTGQPMWARRYRAAGTCGPTGPTLCAGALCWKSDNGEVYAHNPQTGRTRWRTRVCPQGEALWNNLPLEVHAGALWAAGDWLYIFDPCDGQPLHRLESLPPHPNQVHVGQRLQLLVGADQEEVGESALDAWSVEGFLAVVPRAGL
jgi:outer membrane protein assembly factor BamB